MLLIVESPSKCAKIESFITETSRNPKTKSSIDEIPIDNDKLEVGKYYSRTAKSSSSMNLRVV